MLLSIRNILKYGMFKLLLKNYMPYKLSRFHTISSQPRGLSDLLPKLMKKKCKH